MILLPNKAFCSFVRTGSFFLVLFFLGSTLTAAEVTRSLSLEDRVRLLEQQLSSANRMRAESQFEVTNLKNEIRELRGLVEEQGYQLQQIISRQRELYRDIENRLSQPQPANDNLASGNQSQKDSPVSLPQKQNNNDSNNTASAVVTTSIPDTGPGQGPATGVTEVDEERIRVVYDQIFPLVRSKRYDDAIAGYQQFIADRKSVV